MGRAPCCDKQGLKKGPWTPEEDKILVDFIESHGHGSWRSLPKLAGLLRCGKSCRLRWTNYLRPDIKRGPFTPDEQKSIIQLHGIVGNKWSTIATQLPGRTDNEIKNYWNTHLKKRLRRMGLDPDTYAAASPTATTPSSTATRHMAQWESARLEAEARLSRESLLFSSTSSTGSSSHVVIAPKPEPDIFLRMWHSEVGSSFRNPSASGGHHPAAADPEESSPESASTKHGSAATVSAADVESKSCVSSGDGGGEDVVAGAGATDSSCSNEVEVTPEEDAYQLYLDFAGDELSLFHGQLGSYSLFSNDLNDASVLDTDFK